MRTKVRHAASVFLASVAFLPIVVLAASPPPDELFGHLDAIAALARPAPMVSVPEGWFIMGTMRKDDDPYGLETQSEFPQRRLWLNAYQMDRDEVSLSEYLVFLKAQRREPPVELKRLIRHLITVHYLPDYVMAPWPALYVTWQEAADFCQAHRKRLPTEAEWEFAAAGGDLNQLGDAGDENPQPQDREQESLIRPAEQEPADADLDP